MRTQLNSYKWFQSKIATLFAGTLILTFSLREKELPAMSRGLESAEKKRRRFGKRRSLKKPPSSSLSRLGETDAKRQ